MYFLVSEMANFDEVIKWQWTISAKGQTNIPSLFFMGALVGLKLPTVYVIDGHGIKKGTAFFYLKRAEQTL